MSNHLIPGLGIGSEFLGGRLQCGDGTLDAGDLLARLESQADHAKSHGCHDRGDGPADQLHPVQACIDLSDLCFEIGDPTAQRDGLVAQGVDRFSKTAIRLLDLFGKVSVEIPGMTIALASQPRMGCAPSISARTGSPVNCDPAISPSVSEIRFFPEYLGESGD
jgi:hypothetical protein